METKPQQNKLSKTIKDVDPNDVKNPVLKRLLKEVQNESKADNICYDRYHNRHNRS